MFLKTAALTTLLATSALGQTLTTLKDAREYATFMPYTPEQRTTVAETMDKLLSIYVHTESKAKHYGVTDPRVSSKEILAKAANMTDEDFHVSMSKVFTSLRDLHTNYIFPAPHRCLVFFSAYSFAFLDGPQNDRLTNPLVVLQEIEAALVGLSGPDAKKASVGDTLVSINGLSFADYVKSREDFSNGANDYGGPRRALDALSAFGGSRTLRPEADEIKYVLKKASGEEYSVTLPWIVQQNDACIAAYKEAKAGKSLKAAKFAAVNPFLPVAEAKAGTVSKKELLRRANDLAVVDELEAKDLLFKNPSLVDRLKTNAKATDSSVVFWSIWEKKNVGVIYLTGFVPADKSVPNTLRVIRNLLLNELKDTDALIMDIRSNGGGYISLADGLPQYFGATQPGYARALYAPLNDIVFKGQAVGQDWINAYANKKPGQVYTDEILFTPYDVANNEGMAYIKPIGLYHNANCYSACDLMSATFQDNGIATIFSEDGTSGAGGANVVAINDYFTPNYKGLLPTLPYGGTIIGQDARISFRQSTRVLKNKGLLIEDNGILAQDTVRPSMEDILTNSISTFDYISDKLLAEAKATGKDKLYFQASPADTMTSALDEPLTFELEVQGIKTVEVREGDKVIVKGTYDPSKKEKTTVSGPNGMEQAAARRYSIVAFGEDGKQVFQTWRSVRYAVPKGLFVPVKAGSKVEVAFGSKNVAIYADSGSDAQGWNIKDGVLRVGDGVQYADNVKSEFLAHFTTDVTTPISVSLKATYQTEKNYDYLYFGYQTSAGVVQWLSSTNTETNQKVDGIDGKGEIDQTFVIEGVTGDFQVFAIFESDGGSVDVGASIQSITISA